MTDISTTSLQPRLSHRSAAPDRAFQRFWRVAGAAVVAASLWSSPVFAKDPFRTKDVRPIGAKTEAAFKAVFEQGDYKTADRYLQTAENNEPLTHALRAAMAYSNWQGTKDPAQKQALADQFKANAELTRTTAEQMKSSDPLRSNLYVAVSQFYEGAYIIGTQGTVRGTPQALTKLQDAFKRLDEAEKISPQDPELNLIKGFMDLLLSINLPFSNPNDAISRLEKYAGPRYLADRGIAIGYRDLNQQAKALEAVDRALKLTPNNPELLYLKAQILVRQGNNRDSIPLFEQALTKKDQLPAGLVKQITKELDKSKRRLANVGQ